MTFAFKQEKGNGREEAKKKRPAAKNILEYQIDRTEKYLKTSFIRPWERNSPSFPQLAPPTTDLLSLLALGSNARFLASWRSLRFSYYHSGLESLLQSEKKEARDDEDCNTVCTFNQLPVSVYVRCSGWARRFLPPSLCPSSKKPVLASFFPHSLFFFFKMVGGGWAHLVLEGKKRERERTGRRRENLQPLLASFLVPRRGSLIY